MKKIILASALAFACGVYTSDNIKELRGHLHYEAKEGFAKNPYNLRIVHRETGKGLESYILDTRTNEYSKIPDKGYRTNDLLLDKIVDYLMP